MRLAPEDGTALDPLEKSLTVEETVKAGAVPLSVQPPPPSRNTVLQELIQQAMVGVLPTRRPLRPEEPKCFHTTHFAFIYDSLNGKSAAEIGATYNYTSFQVQRILEHPYTEVIEAALLGQMADKLTDPLERMRAYAHEAIDVKVQILRDVSSPKSLRNTIASDFLDRVGYGARKSVEVIQSNKSPDVPNQLLERFAGALEQSNEVRKLGFGAFVKRGEGSDAVKVASPAGGSPTVEENAGGASPTGDPRTPVAEKAEKVA